MIMLCRPPAVHAAATPFNKSVLARCTSLGAPYRSCWFLFNGHVETIFAWAARRCPRLLYYRRCVNLPDGGVLALDFDDSPVSQVPTCACAIPLTPLLYAAALQFR